MFGRGHKLVDILDSFAARRGEVTVVTSDDSILHDLIERRVSRIYADPRSVSLADHGLAPALEDLLVVTDYHEPSLRQTLDNLVPQAGRGTVLVFSHLPAGELAERYPTVFFKSDRSIYRSEMRDLVRKTATTQKVNALREAVRGAGRLVTVMWGNPDPDSIACSYALSELLREDVPDRVVAYTGRYTRPENEAMVEALRMDTRPWSPELLAPGTLLATVDAQPSFFKTNGELKFDVIIDHHPLSDLGSPRYADVRPTYGSTASILTEYYTHTGRRLSRRLATALFYGLKIDTGNLTRNVSDADVNAFRVLRGLADENVIRTIELSQMPQDMLDFFAIAIKNKKLSRDTAFSFIGTVDNADTCVYIADFLIKLAEIAWVIVACRTKEKVVVVFRADGLRKHAGRLAESLFLPYGTAGGHRTMARAELALDKVVPELPSDASDIAIERWLLSKLADSRKALRKFLS